MKNYKLSFLRTNVKTSSKGNEYVQFNYVLDVTEADGTHKSVSGFTIDSKDIVDLANNVYAIEDKYTTEKPVNKNGETIVYYNYNLDKQKEEMKGNK